MLRSSHTSTNSQPENLHANNPTLLPPVQATTTISSVEMNGYSNLVSSPPAPSGGSPSTTPATASTAAEVEAKWEGVAVGAATMVRNLSSASQRFAPVERSKSTNGHRGGGFQAAVRRAFSMRRQPASSLSDGYWRIHDGLDACDDDEAEALEEVVVDEQKKGAEPAQVQGDAASPKKIEKDIKKKKRGTHIVKACKKLLGFKRV